MQDMLTFQASHDELTGLINRREFERRLEDVLIRTRFEECQSVLLYMDLDQFNVVNDTCGHIAGDLLLRQVTSLLKLQIRNTDTLARLGGDEFAVLLPGCQLDTAQRIAEDLRATVSEYRFNWDNRNFCIGVSIGLVAIDKSWQQLDHIMGAADSACYIAKENGRNQVAVYHSGGEEEERRHGEMVWASRIRESLEKNRFHLYCQPIVPVDKNVSERFSIEILVRMLDDNEKLIPPMAFIPAAERYDLMTYIDRWVVTNVARMLKEQKSLFGNVEKCAINLSGQSLANEKFLGFVVKEIETAKIPWDKICFEITETAAVANIGVAQQFISVLSGKGCKFSLDDFGSGLSSFAYLKHLRVDFLKIDGAFVKNMLNDPIDAAMVRSISDVARAMNLRTIAEFVEDDDTLDALREMSVHYAQGYGICPPFPIEELANYKDSWKGNSLSA
jgi:diguanylate cyclase (GGDEF)-like protein